MEDTREPIGEIALHGGNVPEVNPAAATTVPTFCSSNAGIAGIILYFEQYPWYRSRYQPRMVASLLEVA
jgi:hypothetical protein